MKIEKLSPHLESSLQSFFRELETAKVHDFFSPHPFSSKKASDLCHYRGNDEYCVLSEKGKILGYGMLRGWDEGYSIPSLGICLRPGVEGKGLGTLLMNHLINIARLRGAKEILLKVKRDNLRAIHLYEKMGFELQSGSDGFLKGLLALKTQ